MFAASGVTLVVHHHTTSKHREDNIQKISQMRRMDYLEFYPTRMDI
jgi:hypothetical protein